CCRRSAQGRRDPPKGLRRCADPRQCASTVIGARGSSSAMSRLLAPLTDPRALWRALPAAIEGTRPLALGFAPDAADHVPEGTAVVIATSGSTGMPKRVILSGDALRASAEATAKRIGEGQWVLALPAGYVAGLQVLV